MQIKKPNGQLIFITTLIVSILILVGMSLYDRFYHSIHGDASVSDYQIDLSSTNFNRNDVIYLDGKWEFFLKQLVVTDQLTDIKPDFIISVPWRISNYKVCKKKVDGAIYGSYRIKLKNLQQDANITCYIPNPNIAYQVFIDGQKVSYSGVVSKDLNKIYYGMAINTMPFSPLRKGDHELVIEVASKNLTGLFRTPIMGDEEYLHQYRSKLYTFSNILIGMIVMILWIYGGFLISVKQLKVSVWLYILLCCIIMRILLTNECCQTPPKLFSQNGYYPIITLSLLITFISRIVVMRYANQYFKLKIPDNIIKGFSAYFSIFFLVLLVSPHIYPLNSFEVHLGNVVMLLSDILNLYLLYKMYFRVKQNYPFSLLFSVCYIALSTAITIENMYFAGYLKFGGTLWLPVIFTACSIVTIGVTSAKVAAAYKRDLEIAQLQKEIEQSSNLLMLSQIQPHFMYNTLTAILALIKTAPALAEESLKKFAMYLRSNMIFINSKQPIPFSQELMHIQNYVDIEKMRFGVRIQIVYEIETADFVLPALTVQPLVENAIKHGLCPKEDGGTVTLKTYSTNNFNCIEVIDDGVGFDVDRLNNSTTDSMVIPNVKFRLESLVQAQVKIQSEVGKGTRVLVRIPK